MGHKLIHGVYADPRDALSRFKIRCLGQGIASTKFRWVGPQEPPSFTDDEEVVVVLDVTLDTLMRTFDFAWFWANEGWRGRGLWGAVLCDSVPEYLRLLEGAEPFQPFTLQWRRIKLNANLGKSPREVRSPQASPGLALLFVAAQHLQRVTAIDREKRVSWYLPGLESRMPEGKEWPYALRMCTAQRPQRVNLMLHRSECGDRDVAVPIYC